MVAHLDRIAEYLSTQSWQIAVLVAAIALLSSALRNRSAHVRYLLWLIVLAKCLVPPALEVPVAVLPPPAPSVAPESFLMLAPEATAPAPSIPIDEDPAFDAPAGPAASAPLNLRHWLALIGLAGAAFFGFAALAKAASTMRWLRRQRRTLPDDMQASTDTLLSSLGIRPAPRMWLIEGIGQPFVWGLVRGDIYLPTHFARLEDPQCRRDILGHELSHILRFDAAVNTLQIVAQGLFWFHPFVWWANRKMRQEREKCCDEMAIARFGAGVKSYSTAIIDTVAQARQSSRPVPSLAVAGSLKHIEERIKAMMTPGRKFYKHPSLVAAMATALLALLIVPTALVLTARAQTDAAPEPEEKSYDSLYEAAEAGDLAEVKRLIAAGADLKKGGGFRGTALHAAAREGHKEVVELLLEKGADVHTKDCFRTPLHEAVRAGHKEIVEILIAAGANIEGRPRLITPLEVAAAVGHKDVVALLVAKGADVKRSDSSPLHSAARRGHKEIAEILIAAGADVNAKRSERRIGGWTPLHQAATEGHKDVVELLVDNGSDVDAKRDDGGTPVALAMISTGSGYKEVVELLIAKGAKVSDFHLAAYSGDIEKLKRHLQDGVAINTQDECGSTALLVAANSGQKDAVEFLIDQGAKVNTKDPSISTPLFYAAMHNHRDTVDLLLAKGADINASDDAGDTLLHNAVYYESKDAVRLLVDKGANVNARSLRGRTALHEACSLGDKDIMELLISKGADVNAKEEDGWTALREAVSDGHKDIVELLISKGADVNALNKAGWTPFHVACRGGNVPIVEMLLAQGADIHAKTDKGETPLSLAQAQNHSAVVDLLKQHGAKGGSGTPSLLGAISDGDIEQVKLLISKGADVNAKDENGQTPLHLAADRGELEMVRLLLAQGADLRVQDKEGFTPLDRAARRQRKEVVELLLAKGADIKNLGTALHSLAWNGQIDMLDLLLSRGADVEAKNVYQTTPLREAVYNEQYETVKFLIDKGADVYAGGGPILTAVNRNNKKMIELLITKGANISTVMSGETALHSAMQANLPEMVRFLLTKGCETSAINLAAFFGELDRVKELIAKDPNVNARDNCGYTPLYGAICGTHKDVVEFLIDRGATLNVRVPNSKGWTPLMLAVGTQSPDMVRLLIARGAKVNLSAANGNTCLHVAVNRQDRELVGILLDHKANTNAKAGGTCAAWEGWTPFHVACGRGNVPIVEMLLAQGANIHAKTDKGETPLSLAQAQNHSAAVDLLKQHGVKE